MKKALFTAAAVCAAASLIAGCSNSSKPHEKSSQASKSEASQSKPAESGEENKSADSGAEYNLIFADSVATTHPYTLGLTKMIDLMKEKTNGALAGDMFANSQLGSERDLIEGLQLETIQVTCCSTAPLAGFTDAFLVFDLPFLLPDTETARGVLDSEVGMEILHSVTDQGLVGLSWFENGFRDITNNKLPIEKPDDLKGIKIRTMENPMHMAAFQILGADPTPMAFGDLFTALQQGTLDAQENPLAIIDTNKFYEIQKYLSMTGHFYAPAPLFVATEYYNNMDEESQQALQEAADEAAAYERQCLDDMNAELQQTLADNGMVVNEVDKAPFKEAVKPVYDEYTGTGAGQVNPDILAQVQEMLK